MSKSALAAAALIAGAMYAQTPPRSGRAAIETPVNALHSPEVNADRTVTLRFRAPEATAVDVVGEVTTGKGPQRMIERRGWRLDRDCRAASPGDLEL